MKVVSINDKTTAETEKEERKAAVLKILDDMREQIESGEITEFVTCSSRADQAIQVHIACFDIASAVGMFEIGKIQLIDDFNFGPEE